MSGHVEDLWLGLQVLTDQSDGYVAGDVVPMPIKDPTGVQIDKLKIVAWTNDGVFSPSPAIARAVKEAIVALRGCGAEVIELDAAEVERQFRTNEAFDLYCSLIGADGGADGRRLSHGSKLDHRVHRLLWIAGLPRPMRAVIVGGLKRTGQRWMARIVNHARPRSADAYWQLIERKNQLATSVLSNMRQQGVSAIVCPPHALPAMPHVKAFDLLAAASYAMVINLLGQPSGTVATTRVAAGEDANREKSRDTVLRRAKETDSGSVGLPVGVQVSALPWREDITLAIMGVLEKSSAIRPDFPRSYVVPAGQSA